MGTDTLHNHLFIDIETVPAVEDYAMLPEDLRMMWQKRMKIADDDEAGKAGLAQVFRDEAALSAEFGKIVCIGIGAITEKGGGYQITLKALADDDEKSLLKRFCEALTNFTKKQPAILLTGHNIKGFDLPFIGRRMFIQGMALPECLQLHGKKPWEIPHIDTQEHWKFGSANYRDAASFALLAAVFGILTPKDDLCGKEVARVYYEVRNLKRIADYCLKDVLTTALVFLKIQHLTDIHPVPVIVAG